MLLFGGVLADKTRLNDMHYLGPGASDSARLEWSCVVASGAREPGGADLAGGRQQSFQL